MNQEAVAKALDSAIAKAAEVERCRLIENSTEAEVAKGIENSLCSLSRLQSNKMPDYRDKWLPVLYSTWYQPSHINLTYSMIKAMMGQRDSSNLILNKEGKLCVVDFGCGALAMQFGVALAVADALDRGETIKSVRIVSTDDSQRMVDMGNEIWRHFNKEIQKDSQLATLAQACGTIIPDTPTNSVAYRSFAAQHDEDVWLSAIHVAYESNEEKVKYDLSLWKKKTDPSAGFITSYVANNALLKSISPFENNRYRFADVDVHPQITMSHPPEIDRWRRKLYSKIAPHLDNNGLVRGYLNGKPVSWIWRDARVHIYTRRR